MKTKIGFYEKLKQMHEARKGSLSGVSLGVVVAIVSLFIGVYMISKVASIAAINNTSDFYSIYTNLTTNTGTVYDVLILVIIIVALGIGIGVLRSFSSNPMMGSSPSL